MNVQTYRKYNSFFYFECSILISRSFDSTFGNSASILRKPCSVKVDFKSSTLRSSGNV